MKIIDRNKITIIAGIICNNIFMFCVVCFRVGETNGFISQNYEDIFYGFTGLNSANILDSINAINYPIFCLIGFQFE
ncbi:MAG: hypothetical protein L3J71_15465 [Victivallaceae bacterium]|nr:hypothetical protein [Victivallaceae bacterium]